MPANLVCFVRSIHPHGAGIILKIAHSVSKLPSGLSPTRSHISSLRPRQASPGTADARITQADLTHHLFDFVHLGFCMRTPGLAQLSGHHANQVRCLE